MFTNCILWLERERERGEGREKEERSVTKTRAKVINKRSEGAHFLCGRSWSSGGVLWPLGTEALALPQVPAHSKHFPMQSLAFPLEHPLSCACSSSWLFQVHSSFCALEKRMTLAVPLILKPGMLTLESTQCTQKPSDTVC
jgi:hypothetical protein